MSGSIETAIHERIWARFGGADAVSWQLGHERVARIDPIAVPVKPSRAPTAAATRIELDMPIEEVVKMAFQATLGLPAVRRVSRVRD